MSRDFKGRRERAHIDDYVVEDHADHPLATFKTQRDAIDWAKKNGHTPHVARVRHLNDKQKADHWRAVADVAIAHYSHGPGGANVRGG